MNIDISPDKIELGRRAAAYGADLVREAIQQKGHAHIAVATGASQFEMLEHLVREEGINWSAVTAFHLDEYVNLPVTHPASFRRYLQERFVEKLNTPLGKFHAISGEGDAQSECDRLGQLIRQALIDVAFIGIGENGHLAFNDPPADFETEEPYLVVNLDRACRQQQLGEGWFSTLEDVPERAISMSIRQILKCHHIIVSVPDQRKAQAVKDCLAGTISPDAPASILQNHGSTVVYLDEPAASLLPH